MSVAIDRPRAPSKLASEGLFDYLPNRGYTLRTFSVDEVINAYECVPRWKGWRRA
jgi:hypothetical protein